MIAVVQGNLVRDPEIKDFKGKEFLEFTVAENMGKDKPARFTKVSIQNASEFVKNYFKKGARVLCAGSYSSEATKKDGEDIKIWGRIRSSNECCELVNFAKRSDDEAAPAAETKRPAASKGGESRGRKVEPEADDSDPF